MSDIERVNEIERMIAEGRMSAAQVFTQMKQLLPSSKAPASGEVEPVGRITCEDPDFYYGEGRYVLKAEFSSWLDKGTKLYTRLSASVPDGCRHTLEEALAMMTSQPMTLERQADAVTGIRDLLTTTPQTADRWIKCSERVPTEADEDCRGQVWSAYRDPVTKAKSGPHLQSVSMVLLYATDSPEALYWMPTGLKRPTPPQEK